MGRPDDDDGRAGAGAAAAGREGAAAGRGASAAGRGATGGAGGADETTGGRGADAGSGRAGMALGRAGSPGLGRALTILRDSSTRAATAGATGTGAAAMVAAGATTGATGASTGPGDATAAADALPGEALGDGATTDATGAAGSSRTAAGSTGATSLAAACVATALASPEAATFFAAAAFFAGLPSSGCSARVSPSRSARRRSRSACASMIADDWLFASTPIALQRPSTSAFVIPSSLASSCTRMFFAKLVQPFVGVGPSDPCPSADQCLMFFWMDSNALSSDSRAPGLTGRRHARSNARLRTARRMHSGEHSQAPRPGAVRLATTSPSMVRVQRTIVCCGALDRQPTQVRSGAVAAGSAGRFVAILLRGVGHLDGSR